MSGESHSTAHPAQAENAGVGDETMAVRRRVLISGAFLVLQVATGNYGEGAGAVAVGGFWLVVGATLLWMIYRRRSRFAWGFVVFFAVAGAALFAVGAPFGVRFVVIAVAYAGQAWPLITGPVRRHVRQPSR